MGQVYFPEITGEFVLEPDFGLYLAQISDDINHHGIVRELLNPIGGDKFPVTVMWDGKAYDTNMLYENIGFADYFYIGNLSLHPEFSNAEDTGEPFLIMTVRNAIAPMTTQEGSIHTFSVSEKSEDSEDDSDSGFSFIKFLVSPDFPYLPKNIFGWRLAQRQGGGSAVTNVLTCSDGYSLQDKNGLYLIPKEG